MLDFNQFRKRKRPADWLTDSATWCKNKHETCAKKLVRLAKLGKHKLLTSSEPTRTAKSSKHSTGGRSSSTKRRKEIADKCLLKNDAMAAADRRRQTQVSLTLTKSIMMMKIIIMMSGGVGKGWRMMDMGKGKEKGVPSNVLALWALTNVITPAAAAAGSLLWSEASCDLPSTIHTNTCRHTQSSVCVRLGGGVAGNLASVIVMPERVPVTRVVGPRHWQMCQNFLVIFLFCSCSSSSFSCSSSFRSFLCCLV